VIESNDLCRIYREGDHRVTALHDVSFRIGAGERLNIAGRSRSEKTKLLNLRAGLDNAGSGALQVNGDAVSAFRRQEMAEYRLRTMGIVLQSSQLIPQRTAPQNIERPLPGHNRWQAPAHH